MKEMQYIKRVITEQNIFSYKMPTTSWRTADVSVSDFSFQFRLGSVLLKAAPEPAEAVRELLIHSLQRGNTLEHSNQKLEEENQRLSREQQRITTE